MDVAPGAKAGIETVRDRLARLPVSVLNDVLRPLATAPFVLPHPIRPLVAGQSLAGPVFTMEGAVVEGLSVDQSLLEWARLLSRAPAGAIILCQPNTREIALMGELSARALMRKGVIGYVVDGACRDVALVREAALPVWCTHATPADIAGRWRATRLGEPIRIGDVAIESGDWFVGDEDGAIIVPRAIATEVAGLGEAVVGTESDLRTAILAGMDPEAAYLTFRKF